MKVSGIGAARWAWRVALAFSLGGADAAHASFISISNPPDLFPVDSFITGSGPACIGSGPLAGLCTSNNKTTILSSAVSFSSGNEDVVLQGAVTGDTTNPTGSFSLAGTTDLTIIGRASASQLGSFAIDVTSEDYEGLFFGQTVKLSLDPAGVHDGETSISAIAVCGSSCFEGYLIDTTLAITHEISVNGGPPTSIGTAHSSVGAAVPEPSTWAMIFAGFAGLGLAGYRASRKNAAIAARL